MDDTVDNLMDNSSSCPQVARQAAHELSHDGFVQSQQQDVYILFFGKNCLDKGVHNPNPDFSCSSDPDFLCSWLQTWDHLFDDRTLQINRPKSA
jgi:hypothetical protein